MSNPFTDVRNALWSFLDADAALNAFLDAREGAKYRFGESENLPLRLAADDCPALVVSPRRAEVDWETTSAHSVAYEIEARGTVATPEADEIEEFAYLTYAAMRAGLPDFGVAAVEGVEFAGPAFETYKSGGARFSSFTLGVAVRIHAALE